MIHLLADKYLSIEQYLRQISIISKFYVQYVRKTIKLLVLFYPVVLFGI